jgi:CheY-like chemotaxis protein
MAGPCNPVGRWPSPTPALDDEGEQRFELIVLNMGLPDGDSLAWLVRPRQRDRITPTFVLTARHCVADSVQGLQSGADDYLVKPFAAEELEHHHRDASLCAGRRLSGLPDASPRRPAPSPACSPRVS